jgi:hypothetical protein
MPPGISWSGKRFEETKELSEMKDRVDFDIWHRKLSLLWILKLSTTVYMCLGEEKGILGVRSELVRSEF